MAAKVKYNWTLIHREYRTGQLSDSELCRKHGCSRGALQKKRDAEGWVKDLTQQVNEATRAKLITEDANVAGSKVAAKEQGVTRIDAADLNEIELAAQTRLEVVRSHRRDIAKMQEIEQQILAELGDTANPPTKVHVSNYQGTITQTVLGIAVTDRASALQALAGVQHKRVQLERQAFNLDDAERDANKLLIELD